MIAVIVLTSLLLLSVIANVFAARTIIQNVSFISDVSTHIDVLKSVISDSLEQISSAHARISRVADLPLAADDEFVVSVAKSVISARDAVKNVQDALKVVEDMYEDEDE